MAHAFTAARKEFDHRAQNILTALDLDEIHPGAAADLPPRGPLFVECPVKFLQVARPAAETDKLPGFGVLDHHRRGARPAMFDRVENLKRDAVVLAVENLETRFEGLLRNQVADQEDDASLF
ncbi:MAG: hypothetical protein L6W00_05690 [Lentisphaeria bacterium]|nr:MAG: hypothetical protein L6W00_05690 [Lentisphaeria bacterium]